jgi:hypothetical protein
MGDRVQRRSSMIREYMFASRALRLVFSAALATGLIGLFATCSDVTSPKATHIVMTWTGDSSLVSATTSAVAVTVTTNGKLYDNPRFVIKSSDTTIINVYAGGDSIRAMQLGTVTLTVELESALLPQNPPTLVQQIIVVPQSVSFTKLADTLGALGDTLTLNAQALDALGHQIKSVPWVWSALDTTVIHVDAVSGQITSKANGTTKVRAAVSGDTATATIVVAQRVAHFAITPPFAVTLNAIGADTTLTAVARDSLGATVAGVTPQWLLQTPGIVSVNATGTVIALNDGATYVYATRQSARDSVLFTVDQQATRILVTSPTGFAIAAVNGTLVLSVAAFDRLGNPITNDVPVLTSLDPSIAQVVTTTRTVTGLAPGMARIVARLDAVADTVTIAVSNLPTKLTLSAHTDTVPAIGDTIVLRATLYNSLGAAVTGYTPFWYATDSTIVSVGQTGRVAAKASGVTRVIAVFDSLADTCIVTVTNNPTTLRLLVHLDTLHSLGDTVTLPIQFLNARGQSLPATAATWSTDDPTIARVSTGGMVTAIAVGQVYIHAVSGTLRDSALIVVTNGPTSITLNSTLDTLTARGQILYDTATVKNAAGTVLTGYTPTWRSTVPGVATVAANGTITALTDGTTQIIATAGSISATGTVVVRNPTTLIVDNSSINPNQFGTLKAPYIHIGDGANAASPGDTVYVNVGAGPYSETVPLLKNITLIGNPTAYLAGGRDPTKLPLISHDTGTAGIVATSPARVSIRTIAIRHTLDGLAVDARTALIQINQVFVNPSNDPFSSGRGLSVQSTSSATIDSSGVNTVHGYGVQMVHVNNGRVSTTNIKSVSLSTNADTTLGAGIAILYGMGNTVLQNTVRTVAGAQILIDSSTTAIVTGNNIAGESQLMRLLAASSAQVTGNTFNTMLQSGDVFNGNSSTDGRSGLEINQSPSVEVLSNSWTDNQHSQMDAVRMINTGQGGTPVLLLQDAFNGGRYSVNSAQSTWTLRDSHSTGPSNAILLTNTDSVTIDTDTLTNMSAGCVQLTGTGGWLSVTGGYFATCGPAGTPAVAASASNASVSMLNATMSTLGLRAIVATNARGVTVRGSTVIGGPSACTGETAGAIDVTADSATVVGNLISGFSNCSAIAVSSGIVRADSNLMTQNQLGISVVGGLSSFEASNNDIFANLTAGVLNDFASTLGLTNNFWGDARGPANVAPPAATGDTVIGSAIVSPFRSTPLYPGTRAVALVIVRGSGQTGTTGAPLGEAFTLRAVDNIGRPVQGVSVTFSVTAGGGTVNGSSSQMVATGADGLAEVTLTPGSGSNTVSAVAPGLAAITFSATGS